MTASVSSLRAAVWRLAISDEPDQRLLRRLNHQLPTEPEGLARLLSVGQLKLVVVWLSGPVASAALARLISRQLLSPTEAMFVARHVILRPTLDAPPT